MTDGSAARSGRWHAALRIGGVLALIALQIGWLRQPVPLTLKLFQMALFGLAAWRPAVALLVLAGVGPLTATIWALLGSPTLGPRLMESEDPSLTGATGVPLIVIWSTGTALLEQLVLAVLTGVLLRRESAPQRSVLLRPALNVALIAVASAVTLLPARMFAASPDDYGWGTVVTILNGIYATAPQSGQPLAPFFYAGLIVEGLALAWVAERAVRDQPALVRRLIAVSIVACAAAALLNGKALVDAATSLGDWPRSFVRLLATRRVSLQFDKNAAATVFLIVMLSGVALLRRPLSRGLPVAAALATIGAGLWLTGSRAALLCLIVAALGTVVVIASRSLQARRRMGIAAGAILAAAILGAAFYPHTRNYTVEGTAKTRWTLALTAGRMTMSAPLFGIGVGTFIERSGEFGTGATDPTHLTTPHENAHNNFFQVLGEEGLLGLFAFVTLLAAVIAPAARGAATSPEHRWVLAGVGGAILTWLLGHPLLVPEAAFAFWLYFGMLAGLTPVPARPPLRPILRWLPLVVVLSLPFRLVHEVRVADLSHVARQLSAWHRDPDGTSYRVAGQRFALYVAANKSVVVPVRRAPGAPAQLRVEYRADGVLINALTVSGEAWRPLQLRLPSKALRFVRLDVVVSTDDGSALPAACLHVGQDEAH